MPKPKGNGKREDSNGDRFHSLTKENMKNQIFEEYYKAQKLLPEEEWDTFMDSLREPLPTTFRVAGSREVARALNDVMKNTYIPLLQGTTFEDEPIAPPSQIPWYPDDLAWQFNVSKRVLRKNPEFKKFHSFLVYETEIGNISRQEAVSMLPPLFLQVEPHHRVLDMCAAPGSKTAQLLEALHANDTVNASSIPSGLLIANDSDAKRTHLLIHQSARLPSPSFMVTNQDASIYRVIKIPVERNSVSSTVGGAGQTSLLFDRILCDVPCSGDGTMRKNAGIWKRWQPLDGNGLHSLQLRILQRAMKMLHTGGRIVYSTCSFNPVENEAVIAAALNSIPGFMLVDASAYFPALLRKPGITTWKPTTNRSITFFDSFEAYVESLPDDRQKRSHKMLKTHWPPSNADELQLNRCMRIYPHHQDTGGFFIAIVEKVQKPTPMSQQPRDGKRPAEVVDEPVDIKKPRLMDESVEPILEVDDISTMPNSDGDEKIHQRPSKSSTIRHRGKQTTSDGGGSFKEPPFTYLSPEDPVLLSCLEKLNIHSSFPSSNVLVRNPAGEPARSLYLTNDIVKKIIDNNEYTHIRLVTSGTKMFGRQEGKGPDMSFRVLGEGLNVLLPFIPPEFILTGNIATLAILMKGYYPLLSSFPEEFRSAIEAKPFGSHVVRFSAGNRDGVTLTHDLVVPVWKSNVSVGLMIDKKTKSALSVRLFGADITTFGQELAVQKQKSQAAEGSSATVDENES